MNPFTTSEMDERLTRIRERLTEEDIDALVSTDAMSIRYATGFCGEPRTLLLTNNQVVLYTSFRTLPWAEAQTRDIELSTHSDPIEDILNRISHVASIGVDPGIRHQHLLKLTDAWAPRKVVLSSAIDRTREIKSAAEIERLRQSQQHNEAVFNTVLPQIKPGMTERGVQGLILTEIASREVLDGYAFPPIVAAGANAWEIHHLPDSTPLQAGGMIIIDLGVMHQGYASDMTRTVCLGEPSDKMREVYACVSEAQDRAFAAIRTGATNHQVDTAARAVIAGAGLDRGFTHGLGHGIGLETHDPGITLSPNAAERPLEPGMVFTIEPGTYLEGAFGVRIEDTVVVRPDGFENFTRQSKAFTSLPL
jgi:Xaa-Pro aminopeptidase